MTALSRLGYITLFAAAISWPASSAQAASYPTHPVRLVVPFPPSGGTDIVARLVGQTLTEAFDQQFVIDNRPGAASTIGASIAAKAAPDGYTLLFVTASYAISASFYKKLPYDPVKDFTAVSLIASGPLLFVVHPSLKANSIQELVALAKKTPGKLYYASGGAGGINHLAGELFNSLAGTQLVHVPYKGAGPALIGVMGGETQMMIATLGSALPHVKSGKLKALAVGSERRATILPDLPTVAESGVPGYGAENSYGLLAPRGTPTGIVSVLQRKISEALKRDDMRAQLLKLGFEPLTSTPDEFSVYLKREIDKWRQVLKTAGLASDTTQ
jgi:tripartite-type tricarboxylate transporter receptor subunit TctC